ncbi:MAG: EAL domain-containing protein [Nitrosomonadales bacterium]
MLKVAVNLSMDNLASLDFTDWVVRLAAQSGVLPRMIELEVTESRLMGDLRIPLEVLTRLRLKRFRLSIDDFGIGNSSLAQLRDLPFDELKIDQSFVHGAWNNPKLRAMFEHSLGLAKQLGMSAVPKGWKTRRTGIICAKPRVILPKAILSPDRCPPLTCPAGYSPGKPCLTSITDAFD